MERKEGFPGYFSKENGAQLPALPLTGVAVGRSFNLSIPQLLFEPREAIALPACKWTGRTDAFQWS